MRSRALLFAIPVLASCADWTDDVAGPSPSNMPVQATTTQGGLEDRYIVVFRDGAPPGLAESFAASSGATIHFTYAHALNGFAATIPAPAVDGIRRNPWVAYVEPDGIATISGTDASATWGLARIDQRDLPVGSSYTWNHDGSGVTAYILDTGIRTSHNDFGGRASVGFDALGGNGQDCNGHGTHVAGTVGGTEYGVAKNVSLVAVRVLNCQGSGTWSQVIAGIDWVAANRTPLSVANMSLGGGASVSVDNAVTNAINQGVTFAVAAGNSNGADACNYSPARTPTALTVASTTSTDARSSFSNIGQCVDIFAPGSSITSAWHTSDGATNTISGTSMASPHVAGVAALYLDATNGATPAQVEAALESAATVGKVTSAGAGSPNLLLYSLVGGGGGGGNTPPTASFTYSCTNLSCTFTNTSTDAGGSIASSAWTFGDGNGSSETNPGHTYASAGTYTVALTVTDDGGLTNSTSQNVTVTAPSGGITLTASGFKDKGVRTVDLTWSGATTSNVNIYRNNVLVTTTANDGSHRDVIPGKGGGSFTYRVCNTTGGCSSDVAVSF